MQNIAADGGQFLPAGTILGEGEEFVAGITLRGSLPIGDPSVFAVTNRRYVGDYKSGMIGRDRFEFPLRSVVSVGVQTKFSFWRFIIGLLLFLPLTIGGLWTGWSSILELNVLMFAVSAVSAAIGGGLTLVFVIPAYSAVVYVTNSSGFTLYCGLTGFDKAKASEFAAVVSREVMNANAGY